jgi:hypothetical protein
MCLRFYLIFSGVVFLLVGVAHILRLVYQVPVTVGSTTISMALSYGGCVGSLFMLIWAGWLIWDSRKKQG